MDVCASVAMERCDCRRKDCRESEQILTNILNREDGSGTGIAEPRWLSITPITITPTVPSVASVSKVGKIHSLFRAMTTLKGEIHKEPPPDIEFPYFEVIYYDQPESVGIKFKTTDARSKRWPDASQTFHSDGSINSWQPSDEDVQYMWKQKLGEFLADSFLLTDSRLKGCDLRPLSHTFLIRSPADLPTTQHASSR